LHFNRNARNFLIIDSMTRLGEPAPLTLPDEPAKERRLDAGSRRNQPPADAGFTLPLPGNGDLGLLRR